MDTTVQGTTASADAHGRAARGTQPTGHPTQLPPNPLATMTRSLLSSKRPCDRHRDRYHRLGAVESAHSAGNGATRAALSTVRQAEFAPGIDFE